VAVNWYYARGGENFGPFSASQLKELAASGQIGRGDTVWKEGMTRGVPAARVQHLFADAPAAAPPEPPVAAAPPGPSAPEPAEAPAAVPAPPEPAAALAAAGPAEPEKPHGPGSSSAALGARQPKPREKKVISVTGGTISSQDGAVVKFRKKCLRCGYMDTSMTTMPIPNGHLRVNFFCPKCKKNQQTEVHGVG